GNDPVRQSQFSRQIKELEAFFGTALFLRHGKTLRLTEQGQQLATVVRGSLGALRDFGRTCADQPVEFTIGAGDSLIHWLIMPRLGALKREFPKVKLRLRNLRSEDITRGLHDGRLDFGLVRRDAVSRPLANTQLGTLDYALFVPRSLLPGGRKRDFAWTLGNIPVATLAHDGQFDRRLRALAAKLPSPPRFALDCDSFPHAAAALASGQYAAILPRFAAAHLQIPVATIEAPDLNQPRRVVSLAWSPRLLATRELAERLRVFLLETMGF
ncbi:MAG: LysR family transcriptional regulator, partial [Chthoniobacteraceae bacterium]